LKTVTIGLHHLTPEELVSASKKNCQHRLTRDRDFITYINSGQELVKNLIMEGHEIYGVTTGFGASLSKKIQREDMVNSAHNLIAYHNCGLGRFFDQRSTRAILISRLNTLAKGYSGVSYELLCRLSRLVELDILPQIPEEGSVGASGDLTPLSYIGSTLLGKGQVLYRGEICAAADVFRTLDVEPYIFKFKESLSLMNGTSVMTGLACLALDRARYLIRLGEKISALATMAINGNSQQFNPALFALKPHPGQQRVAARIYDYLQENYQNQKPAMLQDPYSIRCAAHVLGALEDGITWYREVIDTELNSCNDNPIVDVKNNALYHGGHFYGGHIAMVMDSMKTQIANLADLFDRQLAILVDPHLNRGLPANLTASKGTSFCHGLKALQISVSAWTAEALKNTMPASTFSRSTECHNQDKVSMGTIAARDCLRVLELTEQCAAATLFASIHGVALRRLCSDIRPSMTISDELEDFIEQHPLLHSDRPLDIELRSMTKAIAEQTLN